MASDAPVKDETNPSHQRPQIPLVQERMPVLTFAAPHPATLADEQLREGCDLRTQRRSGPGGQHRNKTSSGAFLHFTLTGTTAEATERRSQADNREIALVRLRFRLAVEVRTPSLLDSPPDEPSRESQTGSLDPAEHALRAKYHKHPLKLSDRNPDKPAVLALLLNDLHASGGQPSAIAPLWEVSTSSIVRLIKSHPPAFVFLNAVRQHHGRRPLG
ncbi:MAG: peptide chain release factor family protein [Rubripirellula sp.]